MKQKQSKNKTKQSDMYGLATPMTSKLTLNIADRRICTCHGGNNALILKQTVVL